MNRLWLVTGGCFGALILVGVGHQYLNSGAKEASRPAEMKAAEAPLPNEKQEQPALSKVEAYEKLLGLAQTGPLTPELPQGLRRLGGRKAIEPLFALMRSTDGWRTVAACATALQDYQDPRLLPDILARLDETGILDSPGKLPWISKPLFAAYLKDSPELLTGMRLIRTRPSLIGASLEAVARALQSPDPETRRMAKEALDKAVAAKLIEPSQVETLLTRKP